MKRTGVEWCGEQLGYTDKVVLGMCEHRTGMGCLATTIFFVDHTALKKGVLYIGRFLLRTSCLELCKVEI